MNADLIEALLGCLLHDIGKPVQRAALGYRGKHSAIGRAFMKKVWLKDKRNPSAFGDELGEPDISAADRRILDAISYHHGAALRAAAEHGRLPADAPAYIAYIADNIAAGTDRRKADSDADARGASSWERDTPLYSVFNRFGAKPEQRMFAPELLDDRAPINVPAERRVEFDKFRYTEIATKLEEVLTGLDRTEGFLASLLNVLEATVSFVPSSTDASEVVDISLFDHLKLTGAIGSCIWHYLRDAKVSDYRKALLDQQELFYREKVFLLATFDISGIQDFIYTIHSEGAAKMLRARSFYLELLTEHLVDELLDRVGVSRANLNYSGGGHAYLLLPNTAAAREALAVFEGEVNDWLLANFATRLFIATGSAELSAADLMRRQGERPAEWKRRAEQYSGFYRSMSEQLSARKLARYSANQLRALNAPREGVTGERECQVCYVVDDSIRDGRCGLCWALIRVSPHILDQDRRFMLVAGGGGDLPLPFGASLRFLTEAEAAGAVGAASTRRMYAKNKFYAGELQGTRIWVGDYLAQREFSEYARHATGIGRLGVLRLDVDNLGQAFTQGFTAQEGGKFNTVSRTAAFSRMLSLFFRQHINHLLDSPRYRPITGEQPRRPRQATIIYSGGDDVFLVGAWDDVVEFAVELRDRFTDYTQGKLTVSAGVGMFPDKYPVAVMAREVGDLEDAAKSHTHPAGATKDAVALFDKDLTFGWGELRDQVIEVKYRHVAAFFKGSEERGKAFIYKLLELLEQRGDQITLARWVYFLTRMRGLTEAVGFQAFANQLHAWFQDPRDARQLKAALVLYVYSVREKEMPA